MRRLLSVLVTLIVALLGSLFVTPANAGTSTAPRVESGYAYDSHPPTSSATYEITDRAPPSAEYKSTTPDIAARSSSGVSARLDTGTLRSTTTSTTPTEISQDADTTGTTLTATRGDVGELSSLQRSDDAAKTADDWPVLSGIVRDAARGKGNYGLGSGTASQATRAGESWVGEGYRIASDGKTLVSRDGLRTFRRPTWKPNEGTYQANFEYWIGVREGKPFGNGHLDITDMVP